MAQATAPTTAHHVATIDLGARGTAGVWIREAGMIDIDMPTRNGGTYTIGSDPTSTAHTADRLEAGDFRGFGDLTTEQATALATALRAGIRAEGVHGADAPAARRSPCPTWCEDSAQPDHWTHPGTTWQALHTRRFGTVTVYLPQELHDDGERWVGRCEVTLTHPEGSQQMDGETILYVGQAGKVADDLTVATAFATRLELNIAAQVAQGIVTTDEVTR
jgi:hypothetical protein